MIDSLVTLIKDILTALYQPFFPAILISFLAMFVYLFAYENQLGGNGWASALKKWFVQFRRSKQFRRLFFFSFCLSMILFQTILYRRIWQHPLGAVMNDWELWTTDDSTGHIVFTVKCFENIILMMLFSFSLLFTFGKSITKTNRFFSLMWISCKYAFELSVLIECLQLLFHLGTFQFSDVFYNTIGGLLGGLIYWMVVKCKKEKTYHGKDSQSI